MKLFRPIICLFIISGVAASTALAQVTVRGKILDESRSRLPGVVVRLELRTDTTHQFITGTDLGGMFKFSGIPAQTYRLVAIAVGQRTMTMTIRFDGKNLDLDNLIMMAQPIVVSGVTVEGRIPPAIQSGDTTNYTAFFILLLLAVANVQTAPYAD